jgi:hypothetical protein
MRLQAIRHESTHLVVGDRSDARMVTNHDRSNDNVIVPEMSDRHGMLEDAPRVLIGDRQ